MSRVCLNAPKQRRAPLWTRVESAVNRRMNEIDSVGGLKEEVHALAEDRAQMAADLDRAAARANVLEEANRQAIGRIDGAMDTVRAVLSRKAS
ncbi:MAG: DUF4164 family protein [Tepidamorphaceae bacterium]